MSILHRFIAAVSLPQSEDARGEARAMARKAALPGDWLSQILDHHQGIEEAFVAVREAADCTARTHAFRQLSILLTGHAIAEEAVIYPALAHRWDRAQSSAAYDEQAVVKVQMALLEQLNPMSKLFIDKLSYIQRLVGDHIYSEEGGSFLDLKRGLNMAMNAMLSDRYAEEYDRYVIGASLWDL